MFLDILCDFAPTMQKWTWYGPNPEVAFVFSETLEAKACVFSKGVNDHHPDKDTNRKYVLELAAKLRETGRDRRKK